MLQKGSSSKVTEVEVMVGNQWVPGPTPPGKITSATADVLGNDVFLFGGQGSSKSSAIYVLREKSNTWERIQISLYQPRASHASLVINEKGAFLSVFLNVTLIFQSTWSVVKVKIMSKSSKRRDPKHE